MNEGCLWHTGAVGGLCFLWRIAEKSDILVIGKEEFLRFQLTKLQFENLMLKNSTSSWGGTRKTPTIIKDIWCVNNGR